MSKVTLGGLAIMVQNGFEGVENKIATKADLIPMRGDIYELSERVGQLEQRVEYGFDMVAKRFTEIDLRGDVFELQLRMGKIEKRLKAR